MKKTKLPDGSTRVAVTHVCGHEHGYRVMDSTAVYEYERLRYSVCPLCTEALHNVSKKKESLMDEVDSDAWKQPASLAVAAFLRSIDYKKYKDCYVTMHGNSMIETKANGTTAITIECIVST